MIDEPILWGALNRTFISALLITADMERAEAAVLESIAFMNSENVGFTALIEGAIRVAVASRTEVANQTSQNTRAINSTLPPELRRVLQIDSEDRCCFVCRVLAGLPRDLCASLMHLDPHQLDERTSAAISQLALLEPQSYPAADRAPATNPSGRPRENFR